MINELFIHGLMSDILDCTTIWAKKNGPKPRKPFATLNLFGYRKIGMNDERNTDTPGEVEVRETMEATLEVQYFGDDAKNKLINLEQSLSRPTIVDKCFNNGVAFFDAQNVQDLTGLLDSTSYEERASVDLSIRFSSSVVDAPGYFDQIVINGDGNDFTVKEDDNG